jgi:hypothetical protein
MPESKFLPLPQGVLPLEEGPGGYRLQRAGERDMWSSPGSCG